jgi:uncharacterized protein YxeA
MKRLLAILLFALVTVACNTALFVGFRLSRFKTYLTPSTQGSWTEPKSTQNPWTLSEPTNY